ncbi:MaoC family dehydratase [Vibrio kyushuensis]|uniref:MaoC family dehydratase n=1 Tax=Vibrio TaxID=662 RepID=UPI003D124990
MKVANLFKHRGESMSKHHAELKQWMSPTVRTYWEDLLTKTNSSQLFARFKDFHHPAVNEDASTEDASVLKQDVLMPEAKDVYEELQQKIGEVIHTGNWLLVDQQRIDQFGQVTEDMQWIHTDPQRAQEESPFKTTIAHGFLTLALLPRLTDSVDESNSLFPTAKLVVNLGLNQVRFPYPVKSGNNVRAVSRLAKVTPIKKGLEIEREVRVEIEGIRRPGCVVTSVIQVHF